MCRFATLPRPPFKLQNESRTNRARIADSSRNLLRSPQHLALALVGSTRSSLERSNKPRLSGEFLKVCGAAESNQKRGRVNTIQGSFLRLRAAASALLPRPALLSAEARLRGEGGCGERHRRPWAAVLDKERRCEASAMVRGCLRKLERCEYAESPSPGLHRTMLRIAEAIRPLPARGAR
jgi:hypothetical protein